MDNTLEVMLERLRRVPDTHRVFGTPASEARRRFAFDDTLLDELVAAGLPHVATGPELMFDQCDLNNVSTGLGLDSLQRTITKRWTKTLQAQLDHDRGQFEMRLSWRCPQPGHAGACEFRPAPALIGPGTPAPAGNAFTILAEPLAEKHDFGPELDAVVAEARSLSFYAIPDSLAADLGFAQRARLADCRLASRYLATVAARAGLTTRVASGFFVGVPFPAPHAWLEIAVGDRWVPIDPFFLNTLQRWEFLPADEEALRRSPRNVLWRLGTAEELGAPLVRHRLPGAEDSTAAPFGLAAQWRPHH
jgi:Transglutaminase-like superfamily